MCMPKCRNIRSSHHSPDNSPTSSSSHSYPFSEYLPFRVIPIDPKVLELVPYHKTMPTTGMVIKTLGERLKLSSGTSGHKKSMIRSIFWLTSYLSSPEALHKREYVFCVYIQQTWRCQACHKGWRNCMWDCKPYWCFNAGTCSKNSTCYYKLHQQRLSIKRTKHIF